MLGPSVSHRSSANPVSAWREDVVEQGARAVDALQPRVSQSSVVVQTYRTINIALFDQQFDGRAILFRRLNRSFQLFPIEGDVVDGNDLNV